MFKKPQHEHRSTGIASGLQYRDGYAVGGRVRLSHGGPPPHPEDRLAGIVNPRFKLGNIDVSGIKQITEQLMPTVDPNLSQYAIDYSDPSLRTDFSKYKPSKFGAVGEAAAETISQPIPEGQSQIATFIANLGKTSTGVKQRREELEMLADEESKKLKLADLEQKKEIGLAEAGIKQEQLNSQLKFAQDVTKLGIDSELALQLAEMETPAKIQEIQAQMDQGKTFEEATAIVYGMKDDQDRLFTTFLEIYSQPNPMTGIAPPQDDAIQNALDALNKYLGGEIKITPTNPDLNSNSDPKGTENVNPNFEDINS